MKNSKFCPALWLSGFFGLGALAHLIRSVFRFSLIVAGHEIPLTVSVVLFAVFGVLSALALWLGLKRPCCKTETEGERSYCKH